MPDRIMGQTVAFPGDLRRLADAHHRAQPLPRHANNDAEQLNRTIADCDTKIERYRATLDARATHPRRRLDPRDLHHPD
jgi:hypothetical protein